MSEIEQLYLISTTTLEDIKQAIAQVKIIYPDSDLPILYINKNFEYHLINRRTLVQIADDVRKRLGVQKQFKVSELAAALVQLPKLDVPNIQLVSDEGIIVNKSGAILGRAILGQTILGEKGGFGIQLFTPSIFLEEEKPLTKLDAPIISLEEEKILPKLDSPFIWISAKELDEPIDPDGPDTPEESENPEIPESPVLLKLDTPNIFIGSWVLSAPLIELVEV